MMQVDREARQQLITRIAAAGGSDDHLAAVVEAAGVERAVDVALSEMVHRADLAVGSAGDVGFRLRHGVTALDRTVRVERVDGAARASILQGMSSTATPDATVAQSVVELLRGLFGPQGPRSGATRVVRWRERARPRGESGSHSYENSDGRRVTWSLKSIVDVGGALIDDLDGGGDLYARHFASYEAYERFEPRLAGEQL